MRLSVLVMLAVSLSVQAGEFDREQLNGIWAENSSTNPACSSSNPHPRMRFQLSDDGKVLQVNLDRKTELNSGATVDHYSARVLRSNSYSLFISYNADTGDFPENYPKVWELAFVAPGVYRWRSDSWPEGRVNPVVGIRCEQ